MSGRNYKSGSAFLLVLMVMIASLSLVAGIQQVLVRRTTSLRIEQNERILRNALLLGLQEGVSLLSEDEDLSVDALSDSWLQPIAFLTNEGVALRIELEDAQNRFNLNHLTLPPSPDMPWSYLDIFQELVRSEDQPLDRIEFQRFQSYIVEKEIWFEDPEGLSLYPSSVSGEWTRSTSLIALPRPESRPLPMNINTVKPEILEAMVGSSFKAWTDSVLEAREYEPIRNVGSIARTLPDIFQNMLFEMLGVRSEYVMATFTAEVDNTQRTLSALLHRLPGGEVEVIRCQW